MPYIGSKNKIAEWVVSHLPAGEVLVDLFAGGGAITHCATVSGRWRRVISNDIDGTAMQLYAAAVRGELRDERRWISREDFFRLKDSDQYVRWCWSFGNVGESYLYSREIEQWKHALHMARVLGDCSMLRGMGIKGDGSRADVAAHEAEYRDRYIRWWLSRQRLSGVELEELLAQTAADVERGNEELRQYLLAALRESGLTQAEVQRRLGTQMASHYFGRSQWEFPTENAYGKMREFMPALDRNYRELVGLQQLRQRLQSLQSLDSLQSLQSLESLDRLQRLQSLQSLREPELGEGDYEAVVLPSGAVVYCDIPYRGVKGYHGKGFDHERFYSWVERQRELVVVSEYAMPEERFSRVAAVEKIAFLNGKQTRRRREEGLWVPRHQVELYWETMQ